MTKKTVEELLAYNSLTPLERALADALSKAKNNPKEKKEYYGALTDTEKDIAQALNKLRGNNRNANAESKLRRAYAQNMPTARLEGRIKAVASVSNPLTTELELVITMLDLANGNKQGIRRSESANIIDTALHMPLKCRFDGSIKGHIGASVAGVITQVEDKTDRIIGKALLWNEESPDLIEYLKEQQDSLWTSWEVYYTSVEQDRNGTSWLAGVIFAGSCLVSNPAYGKEHSRARITS